MKFHLTIVPNHLRGKLGFLGSITTVLGEFSLFLRNRYHILPERYQMSGNGIEGRYAHFRPWKDENSDHKESFTHKSLLTENESPLYSSSGMTSDAESLENLLLVDFQTFGTFLGDCGIDFSKIRKTHPIQSWLNPGSPVCLSGDLER